MTGRNSTPSLSLLGPPRYRVPFGPFLLALALTPVALGLAGGILIIPFFAAILGLPAQLLLGGPMAWIVSARYANATGHVALDALAAGGFFANILAFPAGLTVLLLTGEHIAQALDTMLFYCGLGVIFAPLEAVIFGMLLRIFAGPLEPLGAEADIFT